MQPARWFTGLACLVCLYLALVLTTDKVKRRLGDPIAVRRRNAPARASRRLQEAKQEGDQFRTEADALQSAVFGLVADVAAIPEDGLTTAEVQRHLEQLSVEPDLVQRVANWCDACDAARYGADAQAVQRLEGQAENLLDELIRVFRAAKLTT